MKPYLKDTMIDLQNSDTWKIHLKIATNFLSSKDVEEQCVMHSKCDNIEFMPNDNANQISGEFFESLLSRYQII